LWSAVCNASGKLFKSTYLHVHWRLGMCVESLCNEVQNLNFNYLFPSFLPFFSPLFLPPSSLFNFYVKYCSSYEF